MNRREKGWKAVCALAMVLVCGMLAACDKLSDDDDMVAEVLPGTWAVSYELLSEEDTGLGFAYDHVVFRQDGTVTIIGPDGNMEGTYRAGSAAIRIEGEAENGEEQLMLWRILSFSASQVRVEYEFEFNEQSITALVTLERTDNME